MFPDSSIVFLDHLVQGMFYNLSVLTICVRVSSGLNGFNNF